MPGKVAKVLTWRWKIEPHKEENADSLAKQKSRSNTRQRELFVKWHEKSYWNCEWISELQVIYTSINFLRK